MRSDGPIAVVVFGELARSPRMCNHARELARAGFDSVLIGYRSMAFESPAGVRVMPLHPPARSAETSGRAAFLCRSAVRFGLTALELLSILLQVRPRAVLVQNPPALAVLLAARALSLRVVLDWHNFGWTMLALRTGAGHSLVRLAERWEVGTARRAHAHFAVSQAMCTELAQRGIDARVLYDRPLAIDAPRACAGGRKLVAVCPAGWTRDEDAGMLLDALSLLPPECLELHLTGDGPLRGSFDGRIEALRRQGWEIHTGFLPEADYRALLRRADIGLSLHRSSSGVDLAMKVVDLFAAGVPVCAYDYGPAIREQVHHGEDGLLFRTAAELAAMLADRAALCRLRVMERETWSDEWPRVVLPVLEEVLQ